MNYQIADFVIRIKNAAMSRRKEVVLPYSKLNKAVGDVLVKERFLENIKEEIVDNVKILKATVNYDKRIPVLQGVRVVSKPSLRVYSGAKKVSRGERTGMNMTVLTTSIGIMTGKEARKKGVGGELLFEVW